MSAQADDTHLPAFPAENTHWMSASCQRTQCVGKGSAVL
jgi:hypothetical protein